MARCRLAAAGGLTNDAAGLSGAGLPNFDLGGEGGSAAFCLTVGAVHQDQAEDIDGNVSNNAPWLAPYMRLVAAPNNIQLTDWGRLWITVIYKPISGQTQATADRTQIISGDTSDVGAIDPPNGVAPFGANLINTGTQTWWAFRGNGRAVFSSAAPAVGNTIDASSQPALRGRHALRADRVPAQVLFEWQAASTA